MNKKNRERILDLQDDLFDTLVRNLLHDPKFEGRQALSKMERKIILPLKTKMRKGFEKRFRKAMDRIPDNQISQLEAELKSGMIELKRLLMSPMVPAPLFIPWCLIQGGRSVAGN